MYSILYAELRAEELLMDSTQLVENCESWIYKMKLVNQQTILEMCFENVIFRYYEKVFY
jgi:hypothetical protein